MGCLRLKSFPPSSEMGRKQPSGTQLC